MKPELFLRWYDPDSKVVRDYLQQNGLEAQVEFIDTDEDEMASTILIHLTGKDDVPCLLIDDEAVFGSRNIVDWLSEHMLGRGDAVIT
jgi:glutaredoxin